MRLPSVLRRYALQAAQPPGAWPIEDPAGQPDAGSDQPPVLHDAPGSIADRWFWLTYDFGRGHRLGTVSALDAPARAFDCVIAGEDPGEAWRSGPPRGRPRPDEEGEGHTMSARVADDVRRFLAGEPPRDVDDVLLLWLVKLGGVANPRLCRVIFPSWWRRMRGARQLRRLRPDLRPHASLETVEVLIEMLRELRPSASVGYLGAPTGP